MDRRIAAPKGKDYVLDQLTAVRPHSEYALFETKQKALMFAAALAYGMGKRIGDSSRDAGTAIRFDIFEKANDDGFVSALAVAEAGDLKVLSEAREEEAIKIFEEFAAAGLEELERRCFTQASADPLDVLVELVNVARRAHEGTGVTLPGMDSEILKDMLG